MVKQMNDGNEYNSSNKIVCLLILERGLDNGMMLTYWDY